MRRLATVAVALAILPSVALAQHAPEPEASEDLPDPRSLSAADWQADLEFLAATIERQHPRPFHTVSEEEFDAAVASLDARIPDLDYAETLVELSRLVAMLGPGDGHSRVRLGPRFISGQVPLRFWHFVDGLWIVSAAPEHSSLAGRRVVVLGGVPVEEALSRVGAIVGADNAFDRRLKTPLYLAMPEMLIGLGLAGEEGVVLEVEVADGETESRVVPFQATEEGKHWSVSSMAHDPARLGAPADWTNMRPPDVAVPLYLSRPDDWYWMEELEEGRVLYAQFNVVGNQDDKPRLADFFAELFEKAEPESVEKLILDVRLNGGGNNFLNRPFIHGLIRSDAMNRRGRTYIVIGRNTFSAAQNLATKLSHETNAVFVGEPTGGSPNHYGDARRVTLPHSGLDVSISTLYWQDGGPMDERPWVPPDIAVDLTAADYAAGRDPVIETVLALDPDEVGQPFERLLTQTFAEEGMEAAVAAYREYKDDPLHRYADTERFMNRAGYFLMGDGMLEEAIGLFRLNVEAYPESWNVYDSLAEALMNAGRNEEAIENYRKSIELNPENSHGARMLEQLMAETSGQDH